jgi:signal transduction histidine kinase
VLIAPVSLEDGDSGEPAGAVFLLVRAPGSAGFDSADLSLLRSAADLAALAHRLSLVHRRLLTQAELESQLLHSQRELERQEERHGRLLAALGGAILRAQALVRHLPVSAAEALRLHLARMANLVEDGQSTDPGLPPPPGRSRPLSDIQSELLESWAILAETLNLSFEESPAPQAEAWMGGGPVVEALHSIMDAVFLQMTPGSTIPLRWKPEPGRLTLEILFPSGTGRVNPDAWSRDVLAAAGLDWRWSESGLSLTFRESPRQGPQTPERLMLGLVTEDLALSGLFQGAADAGGLGLFPLDEEPPAPPLPPFEILIVDARGVKNAVACLRAYRAHPSFATTPALVVRAREQDGPELLSAGATDWLPGALRWESLHHRLQALRRHRELQRKGRAAERLETVRQMAGTLKHEINNPLAVISLQTELLQRKFPEEPKLAKISEQVQRIQGLLQVLQKMRETTDEEYPGGTNILKL